VSPAKTAEPIEVPYGLRTWVGPSSIDNYLENVTITAVAVHGRLNVAINRPTFASSEHHDPILGTFWASKAVDGNRDSFAWKLGNSCFHSSNEQNPWWAVDLGEALTVLGVLFTNRGDQAQRGNVFILS